MRRPQSLLILLSTALAGCRYDGAFMQMDSNAPFPFLGFQLAVDNGTRPPHDGATDNARAEKSRLRLGVSDELTTRPPRLTPPFPDDPTPFSHLPVSLRQNATR